MTISGTARVRDEDGGHGVVGQAAGLLLVETAQNRGSGKTVRGPAAAWGRGQLHHSRSHHHHPASLGAVAQRSLEWAEHADSYRFR